MAKKQFIGKVESAKMQNTVVVELERKFQHPLYKKIIKKHTKLQADTNKIDVKEGMMVKIEETRPMSKNKYFKVIEVIKEGGAATK